MLNLPLDMDNPSSSYRVGSCFANPQKGTYFDGTGYAKAGKTVLSNFIVLTQNAFNTFVIEKSNFLIFHNHCTQSKFFSGDGCDLQLKKIKKQQKNRIFNLV